MCDVVLNGSCSSLAFILKEGPKRFEINVMMHKNEADGKPGKQHSKRDRTFSRDDLHFDTILFHSLQKLNRTKSRGRTKITLKRERMKEAHELAAIQY